MVHCLGWQYLGCVLLLFGRLFLLKWIETESRDTKQHLQNEITHVPLVVSGEAVFHMAHPDMKQA